MQPRPRSFRGRMRSPPRARSVLLALVALSFIACALCWPSPAASLSACKAPSLHVFKREGVLELWCDGKVTREMGATFGANPVGTKEREGDEKTPEGTYHISSRVQSERFHRFLGVSYPDEAALRRAKQKGIQKPGGSIGVHGTTRRLAALARAWIRISGATGLSSVYGPTDGCIGISNEDVEVLYDLVPVGTPIVISPERPRPSSG
jgi:murein L,D-transpeptidase YafK